MKFGGSRDSPNNGVPHLLQKRSESGSKMGGEAYAVTKVDYGRSTLHGGCIMEFVIWVETRFAGRTADIQQVASVERPASIKAPEEIGLSLADGKVVIRDVQRRTSRCSFKLKAN
jgi:hypothetical protein